MKRVRTAISFLVLLLLLPVSLVRADIKTEEKSLVKFEGMLGRMMGLFGGKAAKEGTINTVAVRGDRKATIGDTAGEIIDLREEKVYTLDMRKKTYVVETFAEIRRKILEAQEKAAKAVKQESKETPQQGAEMEMDFSIKETGQKKPINGFDCREVIMTVTMRQKGKTLEEAGGMVMTADTWLGPEIPAMKEILDFDLRYAQKLNVSPLGADADQMATALAMFPGLKEMMAKSQAQQVDAKGAPILTTSTIESVQSAQQQQQAASEKKKEDESGGGGLQINPMKGIGGLFGKKAAAKKDDQAAAPKGRTTVMTTTNELLKVVTAVSDADTAIPAGFKEKK